LTQHPLGAKLPIKKFLNQNIQFPNEASLLRLASALLAETSEVWETGKTYLNVENHNSALN